MGLEVAALVLAGVGVASEVGSMAMEAKAAEATENALDLQAKEQQLQYQQKTLSNYDVLQKTLDAQTAALTTRGVAFTSPSFNAIQRATMNIGSKTQSNTDIESDIAQANIKTEKENVRNKLYASLFGSAANIAFTGAKMAMGMPSGGAAGAGAGASSAPGSLPTLAA